MMKRALALLLTLVLLLAAIPAHAATLLSGVEAELTMRLATRSGPGTQYNGMGSYFSAGTYVQAISRAYDQRNSIWWIQVEFTYRGEKYRAYTGHKRLDIPLTSVPEEGSQGWYTTARECIAWNGPGAGYSQASFTVPAHTQGEVIDCEYNYVHFEYQEPGGQWRRVWLWGGDLQGYDWYPGNSGTPEDSWQDEVILQPEQLTAPQLGGRVFRQGDTDVIILWVQEQLKTLGYYIGYDSQGNDDYDATGHFGSLTQAAVLSFQQSAGLSRTGYITQTLVDTLRMHQQWRQISQTPVYTGGYYAVLDGLFLSPIARGAGTESEIMLVQTMLNRLGYNAGTVDGRFGSRTQTAFHEFQDDYQFSRSTTIKLGHVRTMLAAYVSSGGSVADLQNLLP